MDNNKYHISWSEQQRLTDATYDDFLKSKEWQDKVNARMKYQRMDLLRKGDSTPPS